MTPDAKIAPCLWFDREAEEAANYYVSIFPNSRILSLSHYGPGMHLPEGTVLLVEFELDGRRFSGLNGGPVFKFSEAVSFMIDCETQGEIDDLWERLSAGGEKSRCGWLKDKYGLSWQVVPSALKRMMASGDRNRCNRLMQAVMQMDKLDIARLENAWNAA